MRKLGSWPGKEARDETSYVCRTLIRNDGNMYQVFFSSIKAAILRRKSCIVPS